MPISGVPIDWWAPPSGASVMPDGRGDEQEAGVLVAGVVQRIEAAGDERVVERADRQQPRAEQLVREAEAGEVEEQVVLGDAELEMLAGPALAPRRRRGHLLGAEHVLVVACG